MALATESADHPMLRANSSAPTSRGASSFASWALITKIMPERPAIVTDGEPKPRHTVSVRVERASHPRLQTRNPSTPGLDLKQFPERGMHGAVACLPLLLRIPDQKRQRFRSNPAPISDSIPPQIPTEVRHHDGPLGGAGADIGC